MTNSWDVRDAVPQAMEQQVREKLPQIFAIQKFWRFGWQIFAVADYEMLTSSVESVDRFKYIVIDSLSKPVNT